MEQIVDMDCLEMDSMKTLSSIKPTTTSDHSEGTCLTCRHSKIPRVTPLAQVTWAVARTEMEWELSILGQEGFTSILRFLELSRKSVQLQHMQPRIILNKLDSCRRTLKMCSKTRILKTILELEDSIYLVNLFYLRIGELLALVKKEVDLLELLIRVLEKLLQQICLTCWVTLTLVWWWIYHIFIILLYRLQLQLKLLVNSKVMITSYSNLFQSPLKDKTYLK